jgi:TRAP-type C4-dicarboxylate transport system permease small subunit
MSTPTNSPTAPRILLGLATDAAALAAYASIIYGTWQLSEPAAYIAGGRV